MRSPKETNRLTAPARTVSPPARPDAAFRLNFPRDGRMGVCLERPFLGGQRGAVVSIPNSCCLGLGGVKRVSPIAASAHRLWSFCSKGYSTLTIILWVFFPMTSLTPKKNWDFPNSSHPPLGLPGICPTSCRLTNYNLPAGDSQRKNVAKYMRQIIRRPQVARITPDPFFSFFFFPLPPPTPGTRTVHRITECELGWLGRALLPVPVGLLCTA